MRTATQVKTAIEKPPAEVYRFVASEHARNHAPLLPQTTHDGHRCASSLPICAVRMRRTRGFLDLCKAAGGPQRLCEGTIKNSSRRLDHLPSSRRSRDWAKA